MSQALAERSPILNCCTKLHAPSRGWNRALCTSLDSEPLVSWCVLHCYVDPFTRLIQFSTWLLCTFVYSFPLLSHSPHKAYCRKSTSAGRFPATFTFTLTRDYILSKSDYSRVTWAQNLSSSECPRRNQNIYLECHFGQTCKERLQLAA
jgi:hypothetical protein